MRAPAILLFSAALALAADVTGNWSGRTRMSVNGQVQEDTMYLSLKQTGNKLTGTAGPSAQEQAPIRSGKVEEGRVTFELPVPNGAFQFTLTLEGDQLKGDIVAAAQGQTFKATLEARRAR